MTLRAVAVAVFSCISVAVLRAETPPVVIDGKPFFTAITSHAAFLQDPTGKLTIEDVMSPELSPRFESSAQQIPSFGFTRAAIWVRFTIESSSNRDETVLAELGMSRLSRFDWYVVAGGRVEQTLACGLNAISTDRLGASRHPTISLIVPVGEKRSVYARAQSDTAIWLPLEIGSPLVFDNVTSHRNFWDFALIGFCSALAMLSFGLWAAGARNRLYLSVAIAMAAGAFYFAIFNGLYVWLGGPWPHWVSRQGMLMFAMIFTIMFIKFTQDFLGWDKFSRVEKSIFVAVYIVAGALMLLCAVGPYGVSVIYVQPVQFLAFGMAAVISARQWFRRRGAGLGLFVLAWAVLFSGHFFLFLQIIGLGPMAAVSPYDALRFILPAVFMIFMLAGASAQRAVLQMQTRVATLEKAETEARLGALRYQLNPHFLFNTLTSIEELSHEAPSRIPRLVRRLADFLRLRLEPESSIRLVQEIESVRAYLDIEQVRFEERLKVVYDIDADAEACLVPELVLMPLVENAIKFGFLDSETLEICIAARIHKRKLILRVKNNGSLQRDRKQPRGAGVGTQNLRARLSLKYGDAAKFNLEQKDGFVIAEVEIPAVKSEP